jgi:hypothetical protein
MNEFIKGISSGVIANLLFTILIIIIGWIIYYFTERRKLLLFFNIKDTKRFVIYISNLRILKGGSIGIDNKPRAYSGTTVVYNELLIANKYKERFNYLVPSLSESPSFLSEILFADIKVTILPSPIDENEIEANCSIISFGSPGYNKVSEIIEKETKSIVEFSNDNRSISIKNIPNLKDGRVGFIQRLVTNHDGLTKSKFYAAGLSEHGTIGAGNYLVNNWSRLRKKYKDSESFIIVIRFSSTNLENYTIDLERKIE